jgi:hypothetical protein
MMMTPGAARNDSVRMNRVMSARWIKVVAAVVAAGLAASACGTVKMGAAAITGSNRISSATLTAQVGNLNSAYRADQAKGVKPQRPTAQEAQQVLTWLVLFRIYDKLASQHNINVTPGQVHNQLYGPTGTGGLSGQATASKLTLPEYVSAAGALPPDLLPQLGRYFAILSELEGRIDGGKPPTTQAEQAAVTAKVGHFQCLASKDLGVTVNPQYGVWNYSNYSVVTAPTTLAAAPAPTASASPAVTKAPC